MSERAAVVVIGGTSGIGRAIASAYLAGGAEVTVAGRLADRSEEVAQELGAGCSGLAADISKPHQLSEQLSGLQRVSRLIITAVGAGDNSIGDFDPDVAAEIATMKLVGYPAAIAALRSRFEEDASVLLLGGNSMDKPYPGSTSLTAVNGGVAHLVTTLATELAPHRINAIHPGIVADTPAWEAAGADFLEAVREATPTGRLVTAADVTSIAMALLENPSITGQNLRVDGGSGLS